jgi:threonylcarbamoyladenosine tRNA methylthiotransferase MtaB
MRRQYLFKRYDWIVDRLFASNRELNLGTDLLVGFPEEDRKAFEETYEYVRQVPFAYCHVFPFSPRPGTPAAAFRRVASHAEVTERAAKLRDLSKNKNAAYRKQFVGKALNSLLLCGTGEALTANYIRVRVQDSESRTGFVSVRIHSVDGDATRGAIVH